MVNRTTTKLGRTVSANAVAPMTRREALLTLPPVVYVIEQAGFIKVGHTIEFARRIYGYGPAAEILAWRPGTRADEKAAHAALRPHRAYGNEWYHRTPEVLAFVNDMRIEIGMPELAA